MRARQAQQAAGGAEQGVPAARRERVEAQVLRVSADGGDQPGGRIQPTVLRARGRSDGGEADARVESGADASARAESGAEASARVERAGADASRAEGGAEPGSRPRPGPIAPRERSPTPSSSSCSESEEEDGSSRILLKPVFVPSADRETVVERESRRRAEEEGAAALAARAEERRAQSRAEAAARLEAEDAAEEAAREAGAPQGLDEVQTDSEAEDAEEQQAAWRAREEARLRRDREAALRREREREERERWKAMNEKERAAWLEARDAGGAGGAGGAAAQAGAKPKLAFLQKYYHKGAFFQTAGDAQAEKEALTAPLADRDFSAPTAADRVDRKSLPAVMQRRDFGRRSQSKWTHLAAEDTSRRDAPGADAEEARRRQREARGLA